MSDAGGEQVLAEWHADAAVYWRNHAILAAVFAVAAGAVLLMIGNPFPWAGPLAAILAVFARAAWLRPEALAGVWRLTTTRLNGPDGRIVPLSSVSQVRPLFGEVLIITRAGDKHLIRFLADPASAIAAIERARA